jgi:hypothetical protein
VGNDNLQNAFKAARLNGTVVLIVSLSQQDLTPMTAGRGKGKIAPDALVDEF